jgi:hypothetical protein
VSLPPGASNPEAVGAFDEGRVPMTETVDQQPEPVDEASETGREASTDVSVSPKRRAWMAPWLRSMKVAAVICVAALIAYAVATVYVWRIVEPDSQLPRVGGLLQTWYRFDAVYYIGIAKYGYGFNPWAPAFYPLYPYMIKVADPLIPGQGLVAGMLISAFFAFVTLTMLHRFVDEEFGDKVASRTAFYLAAFPTGYFLFAAYNESLYIALVIISLYAARKGNFWIASAAAMLASSTRLFGILLVVPLAYEYMRQRGWSLRKIRWDAASFLYIPAGVIAFSIWCAIKLHDWLAFAHAQDHWKRSYGWPGEPIWKTLQLMTDGPIMADWRLLGIFETFCTLGAIAMVLLALRGRWKFRPEQRFLLVYAAVPMLLFICTMAGWPHPLMSAPRIVLEWFPIFIVLGMMGSSRSFERVYLFVALMTQALMLAPVLMGYQFVA